MIVVVILTSVVVMVLSVFLVIMAIFFQKMKSALGAMILVKHVQLLMQFIAFLVK